MDIAPSKSVVNGFYLLLNCEGWVHLGPWSRIEWLGDEAALADEHGRILVRYRPGMNCWETDADAFPKYIGYQWSRVLISSSPAPLDPCHG